VAVELTRAAQCANRQSPMCWGSSRLCATSGVRSLIRWNLNAFTADRLLEKLDVLRRRG
jgi:hypothetical protein